MPIVWYRVEVESDLRDATLWYESKRDGLGEEFLGEFWSAIDKIIDRPFSYGVAATGLRACRLSRFCYIIHFRATDFEVLIVAVMAGSRDTAAWIHRA